MDQHEDPKFEQWLKDAARTTYHAPRTPPREEMWARIEAARRDKHVIELRPWLRWAVAAAAVLVLGIGIGRWSRNAPGGSKTAAGTQVSNEIDSLANVAYQVAATQYLSRTEAFLTSFRADANRSANTARLARQARDLLTTTQLMLDSPAADNPRLRALLEDLELVLMQISLLNPVQDGHDRDLITQGMNQSNVLPKLRSAIPAGPVPVRTEGAL
ncbi:MAG: hypothetical protein DMD40_12805 [Gemmatimonadetes bacterium]|nr:MAG: hypothetical protein DMD40_12805 [Gemmatimonadota bacterium]